MKTLHLDADEPGMDFTASLELARVIARQRLGEEAMLLSWYDRERDYESPAGVSECHENCPTKGYWDYAANRGARLAINFAHGKYVFCFL